MNAPRDKHRIFISYRRDDTESSAHRLSVSLAAHFGPGCVLVDYPELLPGADFVQVIRDTFASVDVLIALIGNRWATIADSTGTRRLDKPSDFVRVEISSALADGIRVLPVLVGGTEPPKPTELPDDLRTLAEHEPVEINDSNWEAQLARIAELIENETPRPRAAWKTPR